MRVSLVIAVLSMVLGIATHGLSDEIIQTRAANIAVNNLIAYYSDMAVIEPALEMDENRSVFKDRLAFVMSNKNEIISTLLASKNGYDISNAEQVVNLLFNKTEHPHAYTRERVCAKGNSYFDLSTGNRYVKNSNGFYSQYSRKGMLLRTDVPADQPRLAGSRDVIPLENDCYVLYEKYTDDGNRLMALPVEAPHPKGWLSKKVLLTMN